MCFCGFENKQLYNSKWLVGITDLILHSPVVTIIITGLTLQIVRFALYVFCVYLGTNSHYFPIQHLLTGLYKRRRKCLLCGTDWVFNHDAVCLSPPSLVAATATKPIQCHEMHTHCSVSWECEFEKKACSNRRWPYGLQLSDVLYFPHSFIKHGGKS